VTIPTVIYQEHSNVHTETFRKEEATMKIELTFPEEFAEKEAKGKKVGCGKIRIRYRRGNSGIPHSNDPLQPSSLKGTFHP
jgi:hypothetical protein